MRVVARLCRAVFSHATKVSLICCNCALSAVSLLRLIARSINRSALFPSLPNSLTIPAGLLFPRPRRPPKGPNSSPLPSKPPPKPKPSLKNKNFNFKTNYSLLFRKPQPQQNSRLKSSCFKFSNRTYINTTSNTTKLIL